MKVPAVWCKIEFECGYSLVVEREISNLSAGVRFPLPAHKMTKTIKTIKDAQRLVKDFSERNEWKDTPNIDKFDHLHEELIEMSQHLRYKNEEERIEFFNKNKMIFKDGIGDLFFGTCRLANQLGVDIEEAFEMVSKEILAKYNHKNPENNLVKKK